MKKLILSLVAIATISLSSFGQAPEGFKYQAVVRDAGNLILNNQAVGMQIEILQGGISGTPVYTESFTPTTNTYGLVNLEIGTGTTSDDFTIIDWANDTYFIRTSIDVTGGSSYSVMGTSQLMSVPYALYAKTSGNGAGPIGPQGPAGADGQGGVTTAGTNVTITGAGTGLDPYVVNAGTCGLSIGDTYQGGIIFYLDATGCHGLIAAPSDQSTGILWYNGSYSVTNAVRDGIGAGEFNTERIIANQATGAYAAQICANYQGGNYGDWYLPSKYELNLMYLSIGQGNALGLGNVGGFANNVYWSSTEVDYYNAWFQSFNDGNQYFYFKLTNYYVRAVRAF